jgi:hypothetical protein
MSSFSDFFLKYWPKQAVREKSSTFLKKIYFIKALFYSALIFTSYRFLPATKKKMVLCVA